MNFDNVDSQKRKEILSFISLSLDKIIKPYEAAVQGPLGPRQYYALQIINDSGPLTMSEFANKANIKKQQTTKIVNRLVEMNLVRRIYSKSDRRTIMIAITAAGEEFLQLNSLGSLDCIIDTLSEMPPQDSEAFYEALMMVNGVLKKMPKASIAISEVVG